MGSSTKKKNEKKKDFQKPKLKVGKTRPKADNFTDTSFKSKGIVLKSQSLTFSAPSASSQFSHHVSLLSSRSDSQRRDSLAYLASSIASRPTSAPLPQPAGVLLAKLLPLVLDGNDSVRNHMVKALRTLRREEVEDFAERILLYVRAGMTHLAAGVRASSMDVMGWALDLVPQKLVACPGGWVKTLSYFTVMLGWQGAEGQPGDGAAKVSFGSGGDQTKMLVKIVGNLGGYMAAGLSDEGDEDEEGVKVLTFPLNNVVPYLLPKKARAFAHLDLFGVRRDEEGEMYQEREDRRKVFAKRLQATLTMGLTATKRHGGEVGRAAAMAEKTMVESMRGFEAGSL